MARLFFRGLLIGTFSVFSLLLSSSDSYAKTDRWLVATLEWPPYMCSKCPNNGAAGAALRKILEREGITVEYVFLPWVQAQKVANKPAYVGYFPAWKEEVLETFEMSAPLFSSPVVILQNKKKPLQWQKMSDLKGKKFAVTSGYGNTPEFNKLVEDKVIFTEEFLAEENTLKRLNEGEVDGVLMDYMVAQYYLNEVFPQFKKNIEVNPRIIEKKELYMVFNSYSRSRRHRFVKILEKYNFAKEVDQSLKKK